MKNLSLTKTAGLFLGLLFFFIIIFFMDLEPGRPEITYTFAIAVLMAVWWVTEAIPIAVTSLLPFALYPFLNILPSDGVATKYFNSTIFLYIAGFMMAFAMERWNLHKRIALRLLLIIGVSPGRIIMGFMIATAFLSMWMSNTASTVMMIPIVISVISQFEKSSDPVRSQKFIIALLLALAYSATIGGMSTLIGTPPNLVLTRIYLQSFPELEPITFSRWVVFAFPLTIIMLISTWCLLMVIYKPHKNWVATSDKAYKDELNSLGKMSYEEWVVLVIFSTLALLWIFRNGFEFDSFAIRGWASLLNNPELLSDGNIGILFSILLFLLPSRSKQGEMIMNWQSTKKLPWHIVLLFGGGFALAAGFQESGLSAWFAEKLVVFKNISPFVLTFSVVLFISMLTELTSNVATTQMFLPVLASMAIALDLPPLMLMIPATVAASLAFMLPVATPPNAIVFGTDKFKMMEMAKTGFIINVVKVAITTFYVYYAGKYFFW